MAVANAVDPTSANWVAVTIRVGHRRRRGWATAALSWQNGIWSSLRERRNWEKSENLYYTLEVKTSRL
jgi:hypothetical protein